MELGLRLVVAIVWIDNLYAIICVVLLNSDHAFIILICFTCLREVNAHVHSSTLRVSGSKREWLLDAHAFETNIIGGALMQLFARIRDGEDSWRWASLLDHLLVELHLFN